MITLTQRAAEKVAATKKDMGEESKKFRVAVVGGGCSGYEYQIGFDETQTGDTEYNSNGMDLVVDADSLPFLDGIEIDYVEDLSGSQFVFNNPNAKGGCGCGKSFNA